MIDCGDEGRRYFARVTEESAPLGVPPYTEWRLLGDDATQWDELEESPLLGMIIRGDTSLEDIDVSDLPLSLTVETISTATPSPGNDLPAAA